MTLRNDGSSSVTGLPVLLGCNEAMYQLASRQLLIPLLTPGLTSPFEVCGVGGGRP